MEGLLLLVSSLVLAQDELEQDELAVEVGDTVADWAAAVGADDHWEQKVEVAAGVALEMAVGLFEGEEMALDDPEL